MPCVSLLVELIECHMPQFRVCCPTASELMTVKDVLHLGELTQICN